MIPAPDPAYLVVGLMAAGCGAIFLRLDAASPASRALAWCQLAIGLRLLMSGADNNLQAPGGWVFAMLTETLEAFAILAGIEWGRRVGRTGGVAMHIGIRVLFVISQSLVLVYWGLNLGYLLIAPEASMVEREGTVTVSGLEWAIFAPVLGSALVLAGVAIAVLVATRADPAETIRLKALQLAAPLLLAALILHDDYVPVLLTLGLLVFLAGSVRYLVVQSQRGQFMSQFLSPEVAAMVRTRGIDMALQRERRVLTVVFSDLRGFTNFARTHDSGLVVQVLEHYYHLIGEVAASYGGTVKDHAGDGVLILVGAPIADPQHAAHAAQLALELAERGTAALQELAPGLGVGIGVATGNTTVGAIHGAGRLEYVAVGNPVNLAARLSDRAAAGEVLADLRTVESMGPASGVRAQARDPEPLKGFHEPIPVRALSRETPDAP